MDFYTYHGQIAFKDAINEFLDGKKEKSSLVPNIHGLLVGCDYWKDRRGFHWVIDHSEWNGEFNKRSKVILKKARRMIGKKIYFYIYKHPLPGEWDEESEVYYKKYSNRIFGEGIISKVSEKHYSEKHKDLSCTHIEIKDFIHYPHYVNANKISSLRGRLGLKVSHHGCDLSREECSKISNLGKPKDRI
jgi:hypothetical protein